MNLPRAEAEQNPAGTTAFCGRTRIISNTDIDNPFGAQPVHSFEAVNGNSVAKESKPLLARV
jgi:hypothetical protein